MATILIDDRLWMLGEKIGAGGFGEVFLAYSEQDVAVIKLVPKEAGADRELLFANNLKSADNIVPILGTGEWEGNWVLLMPRAQESLRQYLESTDRPLREDEALPILKDIARALVGLADKGVVHRDLKPENILRLNNAWCLADFGISRYAEATTARDTRKYSTTRPYMSPEQWREQRATSSSDVYAFGIISHELLLGRLPFNGPDYRDQHLRTGTPAIHGIDPRLAGLIEECLYKAPEIRPPANSLLPRLAPLDGLVPSVTGIGKLQALNLNETRRNAERVGSVTHDSHHMDHLRSLAPIAAKQFAIIQESLRAAFRSALPMAMEKQTARGWQVGLKRTRLVISTVSSRSPKLARADGVPFDVVSDGYIAVGTNEYNLTLDDPPMNNQHYAGGAHSLWFCDPDQSGSYGWYETAFVENPRMRPDYDNSFVGFLSYFDEPPCRGYYEPQAFSAHDTEADWALKADEGSFLVSWPFNRLDLENLEDFIDRWANWFALSMDGQLSYSRDFRGPAIQGRGTSQISNDAATPSATSRRRGWWSFKRP